MWGQHLKAAGPLKGYPPKTNTYEIAISSIQLKEALIQLLNNTN